MLKMRPAGKRPLISVVTSVLNGADTLDATIESVARQTFRDYEYIIIDGGSTDATGRIIHQREASIDHWVSERDTGIYDAWNKALAIAQGEWIAFLGSDDRYQEDALERYAETISRADGCQYISSRVQLVKRDQLVRTVGSTWSWPQFSHHMTVAHVGSLHHRSLFDRYGRFDATYRICGDYEFLLRPQSQLRAYFLDHVTVRMNASGLSNANLILALREQARAKRETGGRPALRCALEHRTALMRAHIRKLLWY